MFLPSSSLHRGQEVYVIASPYGLLSPAVFHNSVSRGIISNIALSLPPSSLRSALRSSPAPHASFDSTLLTDETTAIPAFPLADVSFPSQLHFPLQSSPAAAALSAAACSSSSASASSLSLDLHLPSSPPPSLVLTDARCLAGAEGAPVILVPASPASAAAALLPVPLVGLVTLPLHLSAASSPVHFNSVITAEAVWRWLQADAASSPHPRFHSLATAAASTSPLSPSPVCSIGMDVSAMMGRVEKSVVIARVGASWASALVLTADGHIATNAHLLRPFFTVAAAAAAASSSSFSAFTEPPALSSPVSISLSSIPRRWLPATLLFCCHSPWDIAILKIQPPSPLEPLPAAAPCLHSLLLPGQPVYAVGHALFFPSSLRYPTVSRGVLCKVVRGRGGEGEPLLLQSDAAVHNGNSGGALLSAAGHWLGMVTSNVMHTALPPNASVPSSSAAASASVIIPHMNFSIPSRVVLQVLDWVRRRGHGRGVLGLGSETEREEVEGVWGLSLPAVWEVEMKPRSHKYAAVLDMVRKAEAEEAQQSQQQEAETAKAKLSTAAAAATRARL